MGLRFLPLKCVAVERMGRRVLLIGGYSLMACWGSIFTVALCLQVAGVDEGWRVQARLTSTSPLPRPRQSSFPWTLYLAVTCIFASILSFGIGPGEWAQGALGIRHHIEGVMGGWLHGGGVNAMSPGGPQRPPRAGASGREWQEESPEGSPIQTGPGLPLPCLGWGRGEAGREPWPADPCPCPSFQPG